MGIRRTSRSSPPSRRKKNSIFLATLTGHAVARRVEIGEIENSGRPAVRENPPYQGKACVIDISPTPVTNPTRRACAIGNRISSAVAFLDPHLKSVGFGEFGRVKHDAR